MDKQSLFEGIQRFPVGSWGGLRTGKKRREIVRESVCVVCGLVDGVSPNALVVRYIDILNFVSVYEYKHELTKSARH